MKIAQVINSESWGEISPESFERGIGGREGAMVRLGIEWAKLGHEVTNFVPTKRAQRFEENNITSLTTKGISAIETGLPRGFHEYVPLSLAKPSLSTWPYDAVVAWECPSIFDSEHVKEKQKVRLTHLQVAHFAYGERDAAEEHSTGVIALSEWARDFLVHEGLQMDESMLYVRPNGVDINTYPKDRIQQKIQRKNRRHSFVYSSSPDRGLVHLLNMWPKIQKAFPGSKLYVAYGVEKYVEQLMWAHSKVGEMCIQIIQGMKQPNVINLGKIGQKQLAEIQMNSSMWIYLADTIQATETGCITAIENMAAGNACVMSDADCLKTEFEQYSLITPLPFDEDAYIDNLTKFKNEDAFQLATSRARRFAESRDWSLIAPTWIDLFKENANVQKES